MSQGSYNTNVSSDTVTIQPRHFPNPCQIGTGSPYLLSPVGTAGELSPEYVARVEEGMKELENFEALPRFDTVDELLTYLDS